MGDIGTGQIKGLIYMFWTRLTQNHFNDPVFSDLMYITISILISDGDNEKKVKELEDKMNSVPIYNVSIFELEHLIWKNFIKGINYEMTIYDVNVRLGKLYSDMFKIVSEMVVIVTEIGKKYNFEIEFSGDDFGYKGKTEFKI